MFHLHSSPPKLHLRSTQAPSQTHPGFNMCVKLPSWSCSTKFRSQDSCLAFIHEPSPSRSITLHLSSIEVASQFNPGPHIHISPPYKHPYILKSQLHPGHVSPQSRSWYLHLTSIPVTPHLHPCPEKCSSATPMSYLKPILPASRSKDPYIIAIHVSSHLHPGHISPSFISQSVLLKFIHVQSQPHPKSHFHPFHVSPPSRSR